MLTSCSAADQNVVQLMPFNNYTIGQCVARKGVEMCPAENVPFSPEPEVDDFISSSPEPEGHKDSPQHQTQQNQNQQNQNYGILSICY